MLIGGARAVNGTHVGNGWKVFGFVPNLMGTFGNAPAAAKGYHALMVEFSRGSLTPQEQHVVLLR